MINVLFVCLGNICRSPMAEAVFAEMVKGAGLADKIRIDSAGTGSWHVGERAHSGTLRVLREHNIDYQGRARQFTPQDFTRFDYILTMDKENLRDVMRMMPTGPEMDSVEVELFLSYANVVETLSVDEVPDPYYNRKFDQVYELVKKGAAALLAHIRSTHDL